ncbi:hypothetical protein ACWTQ3_004167, partial [Yersinia enterocolitica]
VFNLLKRKEENKEKNISTALRSFLFKLLPLPVILFSNTLSVAVKNNFCIHLIFNSLFNNNKKI